MLFVGSFSKNHCICVLDGKYTEVCMLNYCEKLIGAAYAQCLFCTVCCRDAILNLVLGLVQIEEMTFYDLIAAESLLLVPY